MATQVSGGGRRSAPVAIHELSRNRRIGILLICSMSLLIVGLDVTIVNVALPSIGHDLGASVSGLQWTIDAYSLVLASLLMLSGSSADRLGRRRVFVVGLCVFSAGSLLCSLAPNLELLVVFRMLQAVGGSMLNPVAMSIITNTFTDPRERAQAVGVWGAVVGISMALGPLLGGVLVSSAGWRAIFWINIPVGVAAILLARRYIPESRAPRARRFDPVGQVLMIVLFATLTYGIIEAPQKGWSSPAIVVAFGAAGAALIGLVVYEPRRQEPLIDLRFFRSIPFAAATVTAVAAFADLGGFLFLNTLYLQDVRGLSPFQAGLATLPMAIMTMIASLVSGRMVGTRGPRLPLVFSGAALMAACAVLASIEPTTPFTWLLVAYVIFGLGFGLVNAAHHQCGRIGDAPSPGGGRGRHRLHVPPARLDPRCRRRRRPRHVTAARAPRRQLLGREPRRVVDPDGVRRGRPDPGAARHDPPRHGVGPPYRPGAQPRDVRAGGSSMTITTESGQSRPGGAPATPASVWSTLCDLVLDNHRRREVTEALGLSFGRIRALRRVARRPVSMKELGTALGIDAPYTTVVIDDLESQDLVRRRAHPTDRRAKMVEVTRKGRVLARQADAILATPPPGLQALAAADVEQLSTMLERVTGSRPRTP